MIATYLRMGDGERLAGACDALARQIARHYFLRGGDELQVAREAVARAIVAYRGAPNAEHFHRYVAHAIRNALVSQVRADHCAHRWAGREPLHIEALWWDGGTGDPDEDKARLLPSAPSAQAVFERRQDLRDILAEIARMPVNRRDAVVHLLRGDRYPSPAVKVAACRARQTIAATVDTFEWAPAA